MWKPGRATYCTACSLISTRPCRAITFGCTALATDWKRWIGTALLVRNDFEAITYS